MKNFSKLAWNQCLAKKDWSFADSDMDLNQMAEKLSSTLDEALDEIAPFKSFTVRSQHRFGVSDRTKKLMKSRDETRLNIAIGNSTCHRAILLKKVYI